MLDNMRVKDDKCVDNSVKIVRALEIEEVVIKNSE